MYASPTCLSVRIHFTLGKLIPYARWQTLHDTITVYGFGDGTLFN